LPLGGTQIIVHISPHRLSICLWDRSAVDDRLRPRSLLHFNPVRGAAPRPGPTTGDRRATDQSARSARQIPGLHNFQAAPVLQTTHWLRWLAWAKLRDTPRRYGAVLFRGATNSQFIGLYAAKS
jgi:hypothetical protein